ncbi:hypothetical protein RVR_P1103 (plasmid) [Actinacidiphila reveromycinica]|uniref:Uncharacterized protein n=1 Tax=Actinacidiphila reveromycinica TaxID=659352 RepID=A0A7R6TAC7_9ACTN|nr:DUF6247 family protein [Streptomyces sp. SN-593]BBG20720.1 hypothetical protein RVR_P1103 [Streptomyces sp. SN-593]
MTAQPLDAPTPPPSPTAGADLRTRIARSARAERWLPAFDLEWKQALETARATLSLAQLYAVITTWQRRLDSETVVDAFIASGYDTSDGIAFEDVAGR